MGKARKMAAEFQSQFQEAMREAEMADLKKSFDEVREAASGFGSGNLMTSLQKDVTDAFKIEDVDKPAPAIEPPAAAASEAPAPGEPLAITSEAQSSEAPKDSAKESATDSVAAGQDEFKDAKAS
jgi:sec-independent protein translocase protein TatB